MIYFRFLRSHPEVKLAKKYSLELKLANRRSEIQSTHTGQQTVQFMAVFISSSKMYIIFTLKCIEFSLFFPYNAFGHF